MASDPTSTGDPPAPPPPEIEPAAQEKPAAAANEKPAPPAKEKPAAPAAKISWRTKLLAMAAKLRANAPMLRVLAAALVKQRYFWPALCVAQLLVLLLVVARSGKHATEPEPETHVAPAVPREHVERVATAEADLHEADDRARGGHWEHALAKYRATDPRRRPVHVQYRIGLCHEALGQWEKALEVYRTLAGHAPETPILAAAQVAQARIWVQQGQPAAARILLCELLLRCGDATLTKLPAVEEARYLLGLVLAREALPPAQPGPLQESVAPFLAAAWPLEQALDWAAEGPKLHEEHPVAEPALRWKAETVGFNSPGTGQQTNEQRVITAVMPEANGGDLLDRLAQEGGLETAWTLAARQTVAERRIHFTSHQAAPMDVIPILAGLFGLTWRVDGQKLSLATEAETAKNERALFRMLVARRALRQALLRAPTNGLAAAACLEMGNLEATRGQPRDAASWYERVLREAPRSPAVNVACYNLGLVRRQTDNGKAARDAFFRVVDQAPAHELAPQAYLWIGRTYLEAGEFELAIATLRRALTFTRGTPRQPAAALWLATAYLLNDNPAAAASVLGTNRHGLALEVYRDTTAFLEMLARYRTTPDRLQATRDAGDVLAGLLVLPADGGMLGIPGQLLMGRAYRELGMAEQMVHVYQRALPKARSLVAAEMTCRIAETLQETGKTEAARLMFVKLAQGEGRWAEVAWFRLAELGLRLEQPQETLAWGKKLLSDGTDQKAALRLMGYAYDLLGEHKNAARCFSGQQPE